jgi:hypothetical protein
MPQDPLYLATGCGFRVVSEEVLSVLVPASIAGSMKDEIFSGGLQHSQDRCGAAKEVKPAVVGGDLLIGAGAGTEEVAQLVVGTTEFSGRLWALEPAHRAVAAFDAAMILLQAVIEVLAVAMPHTGAQGRAASREDNCRAHPWSPGRA